MSPTVYGTCRIPCLSFSFLASKFYRRRAGYIKNFEVVDPHRVGRINVELHGRIKDCKALTGKISDPRR
jgi:ribosomal protein S8